MDDDFFEKNDNVFDEDDALDYILFEEAQKEVDKDKTNTGCLPVILLAVSTIGCLATIWFVQ
ncbi:MAG: hypothetical protein RBR67_14875 [Desulfobacterium sp.]|jgi:hypothetical protein|nr:hypothetical protein [Desulfobacterium sp.]